MADPSSRHFLFAATLVVLSSEFASLHKNPAYADTFQKAISIMTYCAKSDPQANRLLYILTTFNHVIVARQPAIPPILRDLPSNPNTPIGTSGNSPNDPMANFFLSHPLNTTSAVPTSNPASATFTPTSSHTQHPQGVQAPTLSRRNSANVSGPSPSPGIMADAEWFHFDSLWENWAAPGASTSAASASTAAVTDPALFNENSLNSFDVSGPPGGSTFATPPMAPTQMDGRFNGGAPGGGMPIPLYPMMRFTE